MRQNRETWESPDVVLKYTLQRALQKPEATILSALQGDLPRMRMLDIGVGGGRTTRHFAHLVREYVGYDYSAGMIAACERIFPDRGGHVSFQVGDARDMRCFADGAWDFVLAAFNTLDYLDHEGRTHALAHIRRILAPGGYLCFSAHNVRSLTPGSLDRHTLRRPFSSWAKAIRYLQIRALTPHLRDARDHEYAIVRDLPRLWTYYVKPEVQVRQLEAAGFDTVRTFSLNDGLEIVPRDRLALVDDKWIYFLARRAQAT